MKVGEVLGLGATSVASAFVPVVNIEAVLAGVAAAGAPAGLTLVVVAAVGQVLGKVLWFWGGRNLERFPWVDRKMQQPRTRAVLQRWQDRAEGRPWFTAGLLLFSAAVGLPPYAVTVILAGVLRVRLDVFLLTGLVGRALRFGAIVAGAQWLVPG